MLVALAIAIPALLLIYRQGALALDVNGTAEAYGEATSRARSRLDALIEDTLRPGDRQGDEGNGFHWHTHVSPVRTVRPPGRNTAVATLFDVGVTVSWSRNGRQRQVDLETRRLGPAVEDMP